MLLFPSLFSFVFGPSSRIILRAEELLTMLKFSNLSFYNTKFIMYHNQEWACALKKKQNFENHLETMTVNYNERENL